MTELVTTTVLDPGDSPASAHGINGGCYERQGSLYYKEVDHMWQAVAIGDTGSTWMCSKCRRVERRTLNA